MDPLDQHMDTPIFEELRTKTLDDVKYGPGSVFAPRSGPIPSIVYAVNPLLPAEIPMDTPKMDRVQLFGYADADLPTDSLFTDGIHTDDGQCCDMGEVQFPEDYRADHEGALPMSWPMRIALALSILIIVACGIAFVVGALASHR